MGKMVVVSFAVILVHGAASCGRPTEDTDRDVPLHFFDIDTSLSHDP